MPGGLGRARPGRADRLAGTDAAAGKSRGPPTAHRQYPSPVASTLGLAGHDTDGLAVLAGLYRLRLVATLLIERGYDDAEAGWMMAASVMVQLISALVAPWLARLGRDQRPALLLLLLMVASGLTLLLIGPSHGVGLASPCWASVRAAASAWR